MNKFIDTAKVGLIQQPYLYPEDWKANTEVYSWARNPYEDLAYRWNFKEIEGEKSLKTRDSEDVPATQIFNECGALAKWMVDKGWRLDTASNLSQPDGKFSEIQKGDIIFFAEQMGISGAFKMYVADMFPGYNYRNITHAAIVTDVYPAPEGSPDRGSSDFSSYPYQLYIIDVPSILENYLKQNSSHFEYRTQMENLLPDKYKYTSGNNLSYYMRSWQTIALICRPDLITNKKSYLELQAEVLGLHQVPKTDKQLEIIKKCRVCSDVEWTPAIDYDRPMPLTGSNSTFEKSYNFSQFDDLQVKTDCYQPMIDGKFLSGVTYKGIPWTAQQPENIGIDGSLLINLNPEAFLSLVEHESVVPFVDEETNKKYPLYGWNDPLELIQFVFGNEAATSDIINGQDLMGMYFNLKYFTGDLEAAPESKIIGIPIYNVLYPEYIELGDVLVSGNNGFYNCGIITDFIKNDKGEVTQIELTEATRFGLENIKEKDGQYGNLIRRKWFTLSELAQWYMIRIDRFSYPSTASADITN